MKAKKRKAIYNIGYQGKTPALLISILKEAKVTLLVDLRERPYSRIPGFNKKQIKSALEEHGIVYKWMGNDLGGFSCTKNQWLEGCKQLAKMSQKETIAMMCLEADFNKCHRKKLAELLAFFHKIGNINL